MAKRLTESQVLVSPGLIDAPVMDMMCSQFVLTLAARQGAKFNAVSYTHLTLPTKA